MKLFGDENIASRMVTRIRKKNGKDELGIQYKNQGTAIKIEFEMGTIAQKGFYCDSCLIILSTLHSNFQQTNITKYGE